MSSTHHDVTTPGPPRVQEVDDGIFAYLQPDGSWWINNTGFLVGQRGVISVDACATVRRTRAYLNAIGTVTTQPVRTLVNTHHHGDHTFGNFLFGGATIVGHEATRAGVVDSGEPSSGPFFTPVDWGDVVLEPPFLTYTDSVTLWVDSLRAEVRHVGMPAHTNNDSIVWIPERKVLYAGDLLFNGGTPFLVQGSLTGAIQVLENVIKPLGAERIIPGHGAVAGPELIDYVVGYLRFVQASAQAGHDAGLSPLDTARELDLGQYAELLDPERIVGNLHRAYAELAAAPLGAAIDISAALTDMVAYNGGRPLSCLA
ncbi:MBL fold metallo-hydrolase [Mycobacterium sp.]|uniref:MBL fold metallo-hydrolase n=1 Tax=Mycobacterium sp. TaxID=1785 RepID=UPI003BA8597B